jgi:tmRNA-binding protein
VELALARGKDHYDKREAIRERDQRRDMERELRRR